MRLPCKHGRYDMHTFHIDPQYCPTWSCQTDHFDTCPGGKVVEVDRIEAAKALDDHLDWSDTEETGFAFVAASLDVIVAAVLDAAIGDPE